MKKNIVLTSLMSLFTCFCLHSTTEAQTVIITGIVKSPDGAVQNARVDLFDEKNNLLDNGITGPDGKFKTEKKIKTGKTIKIKISKAGYEVYETNYEIDNKGNAGQFLLQSKKLVVTGTIRDSTTEEVLKDAEIYFYDQAGRLIQAKSTNSLGYFEIVTDFIYGQKITVKAYRKGYYDKEQTLTITSDERNTMQDIRLPVIGSRGLRAFIRVKDKKSGKPLEGVSVQYLNQRKKAYVDTLLSYKGEIELTLYQKPGSVLDFTISRPGYVTINAQRTLSEEPRENVFVYEMARDTKSALGPILLIGGGAAASVSGFMYFTSQSLYKDYKNYSNYTNAKDRDDDLASAQKKRNIALVTAGVAGSAIIIYVINKISEKRREKIAIQKKMQIGFMQSPPQSTAYIMGSTPVIGFALHF